MAGVLSGYVARSTPLSIRFDAALLSRLRRRAASTTGSSVSALAQRLIDEGLRMADHPGVIFKDGPSGRRAALAFGPDVWEIIKFLREVDERGPAALDAAAEVLAVDANRIAVAVSYYGTTGTRSTRRSLTPTRLLPALRMRGELSGTSLHEPGDWRPARPR
jgi:hypothetical protein